MNQHNFSLEPQGPNLKNLFLAVLLSSAVFIVYAYFFAPAPQTVVTEAEKAQEQKPAIQVDNIQLAAKAHPQSSPDFAKEAFYAFKVSDSESLKLSSYDVVMTNLGGKISQFKLTHFAKDNIFDSKLPNNSLVSLYSADASSSLKKDSPYEVLSQDESSIVFRHVTKEGLKIERKWRFVEKDQITEDVSIKNITDAPLKLALALDFSKEESAKPAPGFFSPGISADSFVISADKYKRLAIADLQKEPKEYSSFKYLGIDEQFFLSAFIPNDASLIEKTLVKGFTEAEKNQQISIQMFLKPKILMKNEEQNFSYKLFIGPKQVDLLSSVKPPLDENIDFGWFGLLSRPMLWLLVKINSFVNNYGLAIILLTFVIKLLTYPLTKKSFSSQQEMKVLSPKLKEIQTKYAHDRNLLAQKQMELYKTHGVNPLAGCLPIFIQFPIWIALFQMLRNSVELYNQPFMLWINDLTLPDPYFVLPVLMGASMFIQQWLTPMPQDQPQMKYVMWFMPVFITFVMLNMPAGLSLYSFVNNILTIAQQMLMKPKVNSASGSA